VRVLVLTDDRVGPVMAGSGLRAFELARALRAAGHPVRLVAAPGSEAPVPGEVEVDSRPRWGWAQAVLVPAWSLPPRALLGRRLLLVDGATPLLAELDVLPSTAEVARRRRTARARLPLVAARADAVLAAGEAQAGWWRARLQRRGEAPVLQVPFGIPDEDPPAEMGQVPGVPRDWAVVLWWGGVWPWLDLDTLLAARARLADLPVSVVVPVAPRPGRSAVAFGPAELSAAAARHGLRPPQVVGLEAWVPYAERHRVLHRASLVAVLHRPGEESDLSFRTRALDGVWAGVPLLLTEGGEVARLARTNGWGAVVPPGDPRAVAATLEVVLMERQQLRFRDRIRDSRSAWRWSEVAKPLVEALPALPRAPRRGLVGASMAAAVELLRRGARR